MNRHLYVRTCIHIYVCTHVYIDVTALMKNLSYLLHNWQSQYYIHVCAAASVFGELWRLEPLSLEKKTMWRREMDWLLSVADHIVELVPAQQVSHNGSNIEVSDYFESYIFLMFLPACNHLCIFKWFSPKISHQYMDYSN